jgi:hypothetical protein
MQFKITYKNGAKETKEGLTASIVGRSALYIGDETADAVNLFNVERIEIYED